jgi:CRISPR/Cas system-associated endoribonuclease Cas2
MANPIKWLGAALVLVLLCPATAGAQEGKWDKTHPRRAQVNKRLGNQNKRIQQGVQNGTLTRGQAKQLHQEDRGIRKEERQDAAQNGGHITSQQQRQINQQQNQVSKQIHQEKQPTP